jgi:hypothetical protein
MLRQLLYFPGGLPLFCTIASFVGYLAFGFTAFYVDAMVGRPSSTSGISVLTTPIVASMLGGLGFILGWTLRFIVSPLVPTWIARARHWTLPVLLMVVVVFAGYSGAGRVLNYEDAARPEVITNLAGFQKSHSGLGRYSITPAVRVVDNVANLSSQLDWTDRRVSFAQAPDSLQVSFGDSRDTVAVPTAGLDYVNFVDAMPVEFGVGRNPALVLLVTGRATGHRALVAIISEAQQLVYLERIECDWDLRSVALALAASPTGDAIIIGWGSPNFYLLGHFDAQP